MKKLLLFAGLLLVLTLRPIEVGSQGTDGMPAPSPSPISTWQLPESVIDNVAVPYDVLSYVQMEYQGFAVTKVKKMVRSGAQVYQLTADSDDQPFNNQVTYLYYDMSWKLLGDEKAMPMQEAAPVTEIQPVLVPAESQVTELDVEPVNEEESEADEELPVEDPAAPPAEPTAP